MKLPSITLTTLLLTLAAPAAINDWFIPGSSHTGPSPIVSLAGVDGENEEPSWLYATAAGELRVTQSQAFPNDPMDAGELLDPNIGPINEASLNGPIKFSLAIRPTTGLRAAAWRRVRNAGTIIQIGELIVAREQSDGTWSITVLDSVNEGLNPTGKMIAQSTDIVFRPEDGTMQVLYQRGGDLYCAFEQSLGGSFSAIPFHQSAGHSGNSVDAVWNHGDRLVAYHQDAILGDIVRSEWHAETLSHELLGPSPPTKVRACRSRVGAAVIYEAEKPDGRRFVELLLDKGYERTRHTSSFIGIYQFDIHDIHFIEHTEELLMLFDGPHIGIDVVNPPSHPVLVTRESDGSNHRVELSSGPFMRRPVVVSDVAEATPVIGYYNAIGSLRTLVDPTFAPSTRGGLPSALEDFLDLDPGEQPRSEHISVTNPTGQFAVLTLRRIKLFESLDAQTFTLPRLPRPDLHFIFEFSYDLKEWAARGLDLADERIDPRTITTTYFIDGTPDYADENPPAVFARLRLSRAPTPDSR